MSGLEHTGVVARVKANLPQAPSDVAKISDMPTVPEVYFDTNAFSDLFRHEDEARETALRRAIESNVRAGRFFLVTSGWTVEELGGLAESRWDVYREITRFVLASVHGLYEETSTLLERELRTGRALIGRERFIPAEQEQILRQAVRRRRQLVVDSYREHVRRAQAASNKHRIGRGDALEKISTQEKLDRLERGEGMRLWCSDLRRFIAQWSADLITEESHRLRIDRPPELPVDSAPTALNFVSYSLARVCWYLRDGRRVERGDDADVHHYACACYSNVFVSDDDRMSGIVALIPQPRAAPISLAEFARTFLR